jgi:hypothetical protein
MVRDIRKGEGRGSSDIPLGTDLVPMDAMLPKVTNNATVDTATYCCKKACSVDTDV